MSAMSTAADTDVFRLRALLDLLEAREHEPCEVEGCTHSHSDTIAEWPRAA